MRFSQVANAASVSKSARTRLELTLGAGRALDQRRLARGSSQSPLVTRIILTPSGGSVPTGRETTEILEMGGTDVMFARKSLTAGERGRGRRLVGDHQAIAGKRAPTVIVVETAAVSVVETAAAPLLRSIDLGCECQEHESLSISAPQGLDLCSALVFRQGWPHYWSRLAQVGRPL